MVAPFAALAAFQLGASVLSAQQDAKNVRRQAKQDVADVNTQIANTRTAAARDIRDNARQRDVQLARMRAALAAAGGPVGALPQSVTFLAEQEAEFAIREERIRTDAIDANRSLIRRGRNIQSEARRASDNTLLEGILGGGLSAGKTVLDNQGRGNRG